MLIALLGGLHRVRLLRVLFGFVALLAVAGLATVSAQAGFAQQGTKLVGTGAVGKARQGASVALSADGNTAIVGGWRGAWVFTRSGGVWTQQGTKLVGTDAIGAATQGWSVALSADGNTAIVGGPNDNVGAGAAWVFTRSGGVWTQQGTKLVGTGAVGRAQQGTSVALSADGNTAIVGGDRDNLNAGAAWVFTRSGGVWTQQGDKLGGAGAVHNPYGAYQGKSVALSSDGDTAMVGGPGDDRNAGAAWVFTRSGGVWTQQGDKLHGAGAVGRFGPQQGTSVALSSDGDTAMVGGAGDNYGAGATWVFTRSGGVWTQQGKKLVGTGAVSTPINTRQGDSVALSADGNTAIVGGSRDNNDVGATWVFTRTDGVWTQHGKKRVGTGAVGKAQQGSSVALSGDGSTAMVGGFDDNGGVGAAWVFVRIGITEILPSAGSVRGGTEVTIIGTNLVNVTGVTFGGEAATDVTEVDANTVLATTPSHAAGAVNVIVRTTTGGGSLTLGYRYRALPTVTTLTSSANPSTYGQRVTFKASVSRGGNAASGKVIFKDGTQRLGTVRLQNGVARFSTTALNVGAHTIQALFVRNGIFAASRATLRQRVKLFHSMPVPD